MAKLDHSNLGVKQSPRLDRLETSPLKRWPRSQLLLRVCILVLAPWLLKLPIRGLMTVHTKSKQAGPCDRLATFWLPLLWRPFGWGVFLTSPGFWLTLVPGTGTFQVLMTSLDAQPTHSLRYHWLAPGRGAVTTLAPLLWAKFCSASLALSFATHWHVPGLVDQFGRVTNTLAPLPRASGRSWRKAGAELGRSRSWTLEAAYFPRLGVFARASFRGLSRHWHVPSIDDQFGRATNTLAPLPLASARSWRSHHTRSATMGKVLLCVFGSFLCYALARSRSR